MPADRARQLEWEGRWLRWAGAAALLGVGLIVASLVAAAQIGGGDGNSEFLRNVEADQAVRLIGGVLQGLGVGLLAIPLYVLFTAVRYRSEAVRGQLVGVVIVGPIFLGVASILIALSTVSAAKEFVADQVPSLLENGVGLGSERADELATEAIDEASWRPLAAGFGIGGQIGFMFAMFYTALHSMRSGLLTRFWGSLGMALAVASFVPSLFQFALLWYVYLGLLLLGWVPGGRPPAWRTGEAIPWPTPGERAAEGMDDSGEPDELSELPGGGNGAGPGGPGGERRKRKQRD